MGNIGAEAKVGLLFMDFERPRRLRVQGLARLDETSARDVFPGAMFLVRVSPLKIFVNCPRYVHKYQRVESSKYVPFVIWCSSTGARSRLANQYSAALEHSSRCPV